MSLIFEIIAWFVLIVITFPVWGGLLLITVLWVHTLAQFIFGRDKNGSD